MHLPSLELSEMGVILLAQIQEVSILNLGHHTDNAEESHALPQSLHANAVAITSSGHNYFLPHQFQFITTHKSITLHNQ
jgi:beta-lactamase superfamily II metal-dependent hydrolase